MGTTPVFLPRKFHGHKSLVGCSPWDRKEQHSTAHAADVYMLTIENLEHAEKCKDENTHDIQYSKVTTINIFIYCQAFF